MIVSFGDKATEKVMNNQWVSSLPQQILPAARRKLVMVDAATVLSDLQSPPGNKLEALKGDLVGFYSIRINDQWRIIFRFSGGSASEVRIVDYH